MPPTPDDIHARRYPVLDAYCPACGKREVLVRSFAGRIVCQNQQCPDQDAASRLLNDPNIAEHLVEIDLGVWMLRHPVVERTNGKMGHCPFTEKMPGQRANNQHLPDGVYLVNLSARGQVWHLRRVRDYAKA